MYIDISQDLMRRMKQHIATGNFRPQKGETFEYKIARDDAEYDDMREHERKQIAKYDPPRNHRGGGGGRPPRA